MYLYDYIGNFYLRQMFGERVLEGKLLSTMCAGISGGGEDDKGVEKNDSQTRPVFLSIYINMNIAAVVKFVKTTM